MKTMKMMLVATFVILATIAGKAQEKKADFFAGKWATITVGTPGGDGKGLIILTRNAEGKLTGYSCAANGEGEKTTFSRVDEKEKSVTVYFKARGYDVYIYLEKVDDNHLTGSTMDMFDTTATRVVETPATTPAN
jgi:hypothetical protein